MKRLYFDYNATAPIKTGLKEKVCEWLDLGIRNAASVHRQGQNAKQLLEKARKSVLGMLGAHEKDQLIFTSGGTESNNMVLNSACQNRGERKRILITPIEHSCVFNTAHHLKKIYGDVEVEMIPVSKNGEINIEEYKKQLGDDVFLVSVMLVNNETGFILPVKEMAKLAQEKGIPFHTDVVCAIGKMPVSFSDLGVDFLSYSSHKFGGLKGAGGVICKANETINPFIIGGSQENEKRAGTVNVIGSLATEYALKETIEHLDEHIAKQKELRIVLKQKIQEAYEQVSFNESNENINQTISASFVGLNGNVLLTNLDLEGISASYGSACASGSLEISRVMRNLGLTIDEARSAIRFSFGDQLSLEDAEDFGERLKRVIERMAE